jgi:hypothetical protein
MNKILLTLLIIWLNSCQIMPTVEPVERCVSIIEQLTPETYSGSCWCHTYQISLEDIGPITEAVKYPLTYCHKRVGFNANDWGRIRIFINELLQYLDYQNDLKIADDTALLMEEN